MKTSDFSFELPVNLIAQFPPEKRGQSRLMTLDRVTGKRTRRMVEELPEILCGSEFLGSGGQPPLLVFNNSKVRKARLIGASEESGAPVEFLLVEKAGNENWKTLVRRAKRRKPKSRYVFYDAEGAKIARAEITGADGEYKMLEFENPISEEWLEKYGHIPLPPYIKRKDAASDAQRYQTIYAKETGSSAAPTAGLHFTREILDRLLLRGIESVFITLHVGLGTFLPVRSENIEDHVMHSETFSIDEDTAQKIESAKSAGRKIVAVGTTSIRTLESAWNGGKISQTRGNTDIFIYPGYKFKIADALFTNFHTPESTLLMLVSAFAGRELILESYAQAVREEYRFFSYGDAMLIY
ncbi:MAG: tRNA preQ1(34) S-adenosylmethionine ribosyltransferase-isomerase QueA [Treponema sp.]|jgi:S-adenosylmethionine:tRNA ribosyltransferase-isomerase|nr:tRNA preQ1(34) S-adenosylmethionine ribosyltransferase-isomerase QueA [Treponema sp.]